MPDLESEPSEHVDYSRPPVNDAVPPHAFAESEFAPGCGRCDKCGGGPGAAIHQAPVDQMARIADALERIADALETDVSVDLMKVRHNTGMGGSL